MKPNRQLSILITIALLLQACADTTKPNQSADTPKDSSLFHNAVLTDNKIAPADTLSKYEWVYDEMKRKGLDGLWDSAYLQLSLRRVTRVNDTTFFITCQYSHRVGGGVHLVSFVNNKIKDSEVIEEGADWDLSSTSIPEDREYKEENGNRFIVTTVNQYVKDTSLLEDDGWFKKFKEGYNLENVELKADSLFMIFTVASDGIIRRDTLQSRKL